MIGYRKEVGCTQEARDKEHNISLLYFLGWLQYNGANLSGYVRSSAYACLSGYVRFSAYACLSGCVRSLSDACLSGYDCIIKLLRASCILGCIVGFAMAVSGCDNDLPWNDPYPYESKEANTRFAAFSERPKHLDPARSYSEPEWAIIGQIYDSPLQYHYLKRPYTLEPSTAVELPTVTYFNAQNQQITNDAPVDTVAYSEYLIRLKKNIYYQPHPAFAKNEQGNLRYLNLPINEAKKYKVLSDFKQTGTRESTAEDYIYQIKRLAEPSLASPIFGLMSKYIEGLSELRQTLEALPPDPVERDLRSFALSGVTLVDKYSFKIRIKGKYPQFQFWLALPFFAPVPWEVAQFYAQESFKSQNISLDWYPVGTGAYMLTENNPERRMILVKNPNFREEFYPTEASIEDRAKGLLANAGKRLPMIDKIIFSLEKEDIPAWTKFLQGYYDISGISSDNFTSTIRFGMQGQPDVSPILKDRGIRLQTSVTPGVWYWAFNMLDETVGGKTEQAKNLRRAIAAAIDVDEFLSIFVNDRGVLAKGPIPPDIFGFEAQIYNKWTVEQAKNWIKKAGLKGKSIYFDSVSTGSPDEIATQAWLQSQFEKIGLRLVLRTSDFNRFQDKVRHGDAQMFFWGWSSDYPDPENFLFLFYGPNGSAKNGGENAVNYNNPEYDTLFEKMRGLKDGPERFELIKQMTKILNDDMPWIYGFNTKAFALYHAWTSVSKPSGLVRNNLKYVSVNPELRAKQQRLWNPPIVWPMWIIILGFILMLLPALYIYHRAVYGKKVGY